MLASNSVVFKFLSSDLIVDDRSFGLINAYGLVLISPEMIRA